MDRLAKMLQGDPMAHAVLLDFAECLQRRVLRDNNISDLDRDHLERAAFHQRTFEPPDGTGRRKLLAAHMRIVEALLRELRAVQKITQYSCAFKLANLGPLLYALRRIKSPPRHRGTLRRAMRGSQ